MFWASAFVAIRHLGKDFSPGSLSLGRLLVGSVCLAVVGAVQRTSRAHRGASVLDRHVIGVLWFGVYNVALNAGEHQVDAGTAAMLIQVSPMLIALLAAMFLGERFTRYLGIGLALAFGGVGLIASRRSDDAATATSSAWLLCLVSAVVYSISLILQKPLVGQAPRRARHLAGVHGRRDQLPTVRWRAGRPRPPRAGVIDLVARLPRRVPDGDRVHAPTPSRSST